MKKLTATLAMSVALLWGGAALAHEGEEHHAEKVMGTVVQVHNAPDATHIDVKTSHGETVTLTADAATKYLKGKTPAALTDVKTGVRVVATVTKAGQVTKVSELQIGAMDAAAAQKGANDAHHEHDSTPHNP